MNEPRRRRGTVSDRRERVPWWTWFVLAVMIAMLIAAGVVVFQASRAARHANAAARSSTAALLAARAASDRLEAAALGSCRRLETERERVNENAAVIYLVLRAANESTPPSDRPALHDLARATTYGPPADCAQAVDHPSSYRAPPPIPFTRLSKSFAAALTAAAIHGEPQPHPRGP